jgi:UDP-N-acetylmuramate--alanine ligase
MSSRDFEHIFLIGIGGIGMSALARYYKHSGKKVSGYDKTSSILTDALMDEGVDIIFEDKAHSIRTIDSQLDSNNTLVIYSAAISSSHVLFQHFKSQNYLMLKRSQALGNITKETENISIAGTHGKTTTSCMISHLLTIGDIPAVSILGGISANTTSNYYNNLTEDSKKISVTEADEFDRSFLHLSPQTAAITSMDADHLDIYGSEENIQKSFLDFAGCVRSGGKLYVQNELQPFFIAAKIECTTYGLNRGQVSAQHVHILNGNYVFDLYYKNDVVRNLLLGIQGKHNVENATVASAIALDYGITEENLRKGLESFKGVKRRFEYVLKEPVVFIDDYAHHPTELDAIIGSVRDMYTEKKITGIFQPHLYSRTRDFADQFARSLSALDEVILLDIYPARELPIEGISSQIIFDQITQSNKKLLSKSEVIDHIKTTSPQILLTLGAGDIDRLVTDLKSTLSSSISDE